MQVWNTLDEWFARRTAIAPGQSIGFVPTMGALHAGHAALVERSRKENDIVVVSIFVNPSQFNDPKDLEKYPRTLEGDLAILKSIGTDDVITPGVADFYPNGYRFRIEQNNQEAVMEEKHRPGFLQGVMTIVMKLLNVVRADRAYFGEKDFQQLRTVTDMARDFFMPTEIVACETVREPSGLAMSSRNTLLSPAGRVKAAAIFKALSSSQDAAANLEAEGFKVDYVEEHWNRRFAAAFLEGVRLIDNVPIGGAK
jgi:pantoate--beta-alanine ligase